MKLEDNRAAERKSRAESGIRILACGTCLDYLNLKEKLVIGEITNMYTIVELLCKGEQTLIL